MRSGLALVLFFFLPTYSAFPFVSLVALTISPFVIWRGPFSRLCRSPLVVSSPLLFFSPTLAPPISPRSHSRQAGQQDEMGQTSDRRAEQKTRLTAGGSGEAAEEGGRGNGEWGRYVLGVACGIECVRLWLVPSTMWAVVDEG